MSQSMAVKGFSSTPADLARLLFLRCEWISTPAQKSLSIHLSDLKIILVSSFSKTWKCVTFEQQFYLLHSYVCFCQRWWLSFRRARLVVWNCCYANLLQDGSGFKVQKLYSARQPWTKFKYLYVFIKKLFDVIQTFDRKLNSYTTWKPRSQYLFFMTAAYIT